MAAVVSFTEFLISVAYIFSCFLSLNAKTSNRISFSARIININSAQSPYYNLNTTNSDQMHAATHRSYATIDSNIASPNDIATSAWPEKREYMMEYYIGKPPVRTYGLIDTASSLVWLQCHPCAGCPKQSVPLFNPLKSTSYVPVTCDEPHCRKVRAHYCNDLNLCQYEISYLDGTYFKGSIAYETLYFRDKDIKVGNYTWDFVVIGCGHDNQDPTEGQIKQPGIIGLNRSPLSLIQQLVIDRRFVYCFGDSVDIHADGYIKFGEAASLHGDQTPILSLAGARNMHYYLNLEGISVDDILLSIPEDTFTFKPGEFNGGFIIDSGATYTRLNTTSFNILSDKLDLLLGKDHFRYRNLQVCYEGETYEFAEGPRITFHFSGADLKLAPWSTWVIVSNDIYCLGMHPTEDKSILGNHQQQNVEFGYDLENNVISINSMMSCSNLGL